MTDEGSLWVKRFIPKKGIFDTEIRFLREGDLFWYEEGGKVSPIPGTPPARIKAMQTFYFVAVGEPGWTKTNKGRKFTGIKYREATLSEINKMTKLHRITQNPPS